MTTKEDRLADAPDITDEDLEALRQFAHDCYLKGGRKFPAGKLRDRLRKGGWIESYKPTLQNGLGIRWRPTQAALSMLYPKEAADA
jgi:hypothetical protein